MAGSPRGIFGRLIDGFLEPWTRPIGIDLGTDNVRFVQPGRDLVLMEPSMLAMRAGGPPISEVLQYEAGYAVKYMWERMPAGIEVVSPLRDGLVVDTEAAGRMLRLLLRKLKCGRVHALVSAPAGANPAQVDAVKEAARLAGAVGAGLPMSSPKGCMAVDMGAGRTEAAVFSAGQIVVLESIDVGGNELDQALADYVYREHGVVVGLRAAHEAKIMAGSVKPFDGDAVGDGVSVYGLEAKGDPGAEPWTVELAVPEVREALEDTVAQIVAAARRCLEKTAGNLAAGLEESRIVLFGGCSLLTGMDQRVAEETGLPVRVAEDPLAATARGLATMLKAGLRA